MESETQRELSLCADILHTYMNIDEKILLKNMKLSS